MATIRAYLKPGPHLSQLAGFPAFAFGVMASDSKTDPNIELPESVLTNGLRPEIMAVAHSYSVHDVFVSPVSYRKPGVYVLNDATARLEHIGNSKYIAKAYGKTLANVAELCERIQIGTIAPIVQYDGKQVESTVLGVKEAAHRLIDAIALAFGQWRGRWHRRFE